MISVKKESWNSIWPECNSLMQEHFREVRRDTVTRPFGVDAEGAERLDKAGMMEVFAARNEGKLVGYLIWFITPDFESLGNKIATMGPFYAVKEAPGVGTVLWREGIKRLLELGIKFAVAHHSAHGPRQANARKLYESMGGYEYEFKYAIKLR